MIRPGRKKFRWAQKLLGASAIVLALGGWSTSLAQASFFEGSSVLLKTGGGAMVRQAGAHPDISLEFNFAAMAPGAGVEVPIEGSKAIPVAHVRDIEVGLPPGLVANPSVAAECKFSDLFVATQQGSCPTAAQVGFIEVFTTPNFEGRDTDIRKPIYSMVHGNEAPALFAFKFLNSVGIISPHVRPGDYGVTTASLAISPSVPIYRIEAEFWGVPGDSSHDAKRTGEATVTEPFRPIGAPAIGPPNAFLSLPTYCPSTSSSIGISVDSWEDPKTTLTSSLSSDGNGVPLIVEGCEQVPFAPSISARATTEKTGSPSGLNVSIKVPQSDSPDALASADVRKTVVTLPNGFAISTSSANGLGACSLAQMSIGTSNAPTCPDSSKIGSVKIKTPLLKEELEGSVVLAKQGDNPFGSLLALYLAIKGPGFYLKLPGHVEADPSTGQLTTTFDDTPQLPFEELQLSLDSGPRAPLQSPSQCGNYSAHIEMTSWAKPAPLSFDSPILINEGCATGGFNPTLKAGATNPVAGKSSPFTVRVLRNDNEQNIGRIDATLPQGVLAKLAGVPLCSNALAVSGSCPVSSRVGTTTVGAGVGSQPLFVPQAGKEPTAIYLAGPYRGAPYSIVVKVPAQAGPFDLGTVAVRSGIYVDPITTQVSVKSDPLPQILEGIPLSYRDVRVEINRPDFTLNPTSCEPMKVDSTIFSAQGASASPSSRFQVAGCAELGFKPKLALSLSGAKTRRGGYPALRATLTTRKGDANIGRAAVTLPRTEILENAHIGTVCTRVQYAANACPAKSVYGYAKAWTPLLDKPIQGPVYLRSSNHKLPDLVASLDGQIHVDLDGRIDSVRSRIRNTFDFVPDAPVTKFVLSMKGGSKGLLVNNTELCKANPQAEAKFDGQNGKAETLRPMVKVSGCGSKGKK